MDKSIDLLQVQTSVRNALDEAGDVGVLSERLLQILQDEVKDNPYLLKTEISDEEDLVKASLGDFDIKFYDDGYGPLWWARNSMGTVGIVRARNISDANEILEDEFFPKATQKEIDAFAEEYGANWPEDAAWNEGYGYCPNGGIYHKDLNGEYLDELDSEGQETAGIQIYVTKELDV